MIFRTRYFLPIFFFFCVDATYSSNINPGVVNFQKIQQKSNEYQRERDRLKTLKERRLGYIEMTRKKLNDEISYLKKKMHEYPPDKLRRKKLTLYRKKETLARREQQIEEIFEERFRQAKENLLEQIRNFLNQETKSMSINVIFNRSAPPDHFRVKWNSPERDITESILSHINKTP